jgi:hypothetical protein
MAILFPIAVPTQYTASPDNESLMILTIAAILVRPAKPAVQSTSLVRGGRPLKNKLRDVDVFARTNEIQLFFFLLQAGAIFGDQTTLISDSCILTCLSCKCDIR